MRKVSFLASFLIVAGFSTTSFIATGMSDAEAHEVPYGPAGCGLGHMIVGNKSGFTQLLAATTNGYFGFQAFGITTGTLDCDVSGGDGSAMIFIEANREAVAKDISRGSGETIVSLAEIASCEDSDTLGTYLQSRFDTIFPDAAVSDHQVSENIVQLMQENTELNCSAVSPT